MTTPTLDLLSYHEAGHAVAAFMTHRAIGRVSILPPPKVMNHNALGWVELVHDPAFRPGPRLRRQLTRETYICMAGPAASYVAKDRGELAVTRHYLNRILSTEITRVWKDGTIKRLCPTKPAAVYFMCKQADLASETFRNDPAAWRAVRGLATALMKHRRIGGRAARRIIVDAIHDFKNMENETGSSP